tara:strand:- start:19889 stop:20461 length:573 start_codon:yes stop_codon:yes gene_type:complete
MKEPNNDRIKRLNDDLIKRLEEEMNSKATDSGIDMQKDKVKQYQEETKPSYEIRKRRILNLMRNKNIDGISEEFTKMLCDLAMDIITFAPLGTFEDLLHDVYQNQKRCSEITSEELDQLEREESIGVDCAISWIMGSFYKRNNIKPSDDRGEVLLHGLSVCVNKYIESVKLIPMDDVDDIEIPKKGDQDD